MKLVLVTGGAGHIGSHLIEELLKDKGVKIISLDNYFIGSTKNHIASDRVEYRKGSTANIFKLIPETPDIIYHLGEYARVKPSIIEPGKVFEMNIVGTIQVVEFCRLRKIKKLVYAGSSTKFGDDGKGGEGRSQSPYSFSKATNVDLINNYGKWYGLDYAICYFFNVYGPRELGVGIYATLIAKNEYAYLHDKPLLIDGDGSQTRNFTHVKDIVRGIALVGKKGSGDGYALNNTKSYSILEIAKAFGGKIKLSNENPGRSGKGDLPTKAHQELGWSAEIDILDYIKDFVAKNPRKA